MRKVGRVRITRIGREEKAEKKAEKRSVAMKKEKPGIQ